MPITQSESGLTAAEYAEVQTLKDLPAYSIIAERYNLSFRLRRDKLRSVHGTDAAVSGSYLVRAYNVDTSLYIEQSPAGGDNWALKLTIAAGIDSTVSPSIIAAGATVRMFYYTGTNVAYRESADNGGTWGAEVVIGAQADVSELAASYLTKLHTVSYSNPNARLHYWLYDCGTWTKTDSNIYWPHEFDGFDAIPVSGPKDLLVFSTYLQTRYNDTRQGIVGMFESNGRWSEHFDIDVVDEGTDYRYRRYPRLTPRPATASGDWILNITHDDEDLVGAYNSVITDSGDLMATRYAALGGSKAGVQAHADDQSDIYVEKNLLCPSSGILRLRFHVKYEDVTAAGGEYIRLAQLGTGARLNWYLAYTNNAGDTLRSYIYDDGGAVENVEVDAASDGEDLTIEVLLVRATTAVSNDGIIRVWVNGAQQHSRTNLDNNALMGTLDKFRAGAFTFTGAPTGEFYFDQLVVYDTVGEIGAASPDYSDDLFLLTFYGSDGTEDNPVVDRCSTRSKDGLWWEKRTFCACNEGGYASLLVLGAYAYMIGISKTFVSDATRYVGYEPSTGDGALYGEIKQDIIRNLTSEMARMRQTNMIISDEGGTYAAGMFSENNTIMMLYYLGYQSATLSDLVVPYSMEEVDFFRIITALSFTGVQLSSRDRMAWLMDPTRAADHTREWESQLLGRDRFKDDTDTGYGGLRHTAGDGGHWRTENERLKLLTSNEVRQAHNTFSVGIGNGVIRSGVMYATDSNSELIGLTYRCQTVDGDGFKNYFRVCFEDAQDKVCLRKVVNNVAGSILASSAALGWSAETQYYLMVEFRYKRVVAYYSTDGITWVQAFAYIDTDSSATAGEMVEGYVGYIGQGYSDEDEEEQDPDPPDGPPEDPWPPGAGDALYIADLNDGVFYLPENGGNWYVRDDPVTGALTDTQQLGWDPWWKTPSKQNSSDIEDSIWFRCHVGKIYRTVNGGKDWTDVTPSSDPPDSWSDAIPPTVADVTFKQRVDNIHVDGQHIFLAEWQEAGGDWRSWLLKTEDDGATWAWTTLYAATGDNIFGDGSYTNSGCTVGGTFSDMDNVADETAWRVETNGAATYVEITPPSAISAGDVFSVRGKKQSGITGSLMILEWDGGAWVQNAAAALDPNASWHWNYPVAQYSYTKIRLRRKIGDFFDCDWRLDCLYVDGPAYAETRAIWADVDSEDGSILWLTVWRDDVLYLEKWGTAAMTMSTRYSLGSATEGEVAAKTYIAYPMTPHGDKDLCYIYGRMQDPQSLGDPAHIIKTDDGGTSFTLVQDGWGTDICASLQVGQLFEGSRRMACVRNNGDTTSEFYWGDDDVITKSADITFEINVDAFSVSGNGNMAVGSNAAGGTNQVRYAEYPYDNFRNITFDLNMGALTGIMSVVFI